MPLGNILPPSPTSNSNPPGIFDDWQRALSDRIIVTPSQGQSLGDLPGGGFFAFDYIGDEDVVMDNEATDHWLEDNTAVQDQIGVKPNIITLRGFASELVLTATLGNLLSTTLASVENGLSQVDAYLGKYTPGATDALLNAITQAQNVAVQIEQTAGRLAAIASIFGPPHQTRQQQAFSTLSTLRNARVLFTVFTPFQVFYNMTIIGLKAKQSAATRTMADFSVTLKQLQFSNDISVSNYYANASGRAAVDGQAQVDNGATSGSVGANVATTLGSAFHL